jgi:hypothetical protein
MCSGQKGLEVVKELALLQMYRHVLDDQLLRCPLLTWDNDLNMPDFRPYAVVKTTSILKVLHLSPNFQRKSEFFVNKSKL